MTTTNDELEAATLAMQHSKKLQLKAYKAYEKVLNEGNNLQENKSDEANLDSSEI